MRRKVWARGWMLLLISVAAGCTSSLITPTDQPLPEMIDHCGVGCPLGGGPQTLHRNGYSLNNNGSTKFANWVAYRITKDTSAPGRHRNWRSDPQISAHETLDPDDYHAAYKTLSVDRGHQANLASMGAVPNWQALNYLSNITPQKEGLNKGAWARLEERERSMSRAVEIEAVYVITGPLYERYMGTLPEAKKQHTIPSGYWKIIYIGHSPAEGDHAAFVMDQMTPRNADFCQYQVTVEEIERRAGLVMWSGLAPEAQAAVKGRAGRLPQRLGCK